MNAFEFKGFLSGLAFLFLIALQYIFSVARGTALIIVTQSLFSNLRRRCQCLHALTTPEHGDSVKISSTPFDTQAMEETSFPTVTEDEHNFAPPAVPWPSALRKHSSASWPRLFLGASGIFGFATSFGGFAPLDGNSLIEVYRLLALPICLHVGTVLLVLSEEFNRSFAFIANNGTQLVVRIGSLFQLL